MYTVGTVDRDSWMLKSVRKFSNLDDAIAHSNRFPEYGETVPLVTNGEVWFNRYFEEEVPPIIPYPKRSFDDSY